MRGKAQWPITNTAAIAIRFISTIDLFLQPSIQPARHGILSLVENETEGNARRRSRSPVGSVVFVPFWFVRLSLRHTGHQPKERAWSPLTKQPAKDNQSGCSRNSSAKPSNIRHDTRERTPIRWPGAKGPLPPVGTLTSLLITSASYQSPFLHSGSKPDVDRQGFTTRTTRPAIRGFVFLPPTPAPAD